MARVPGADVATAGTMRWSADELSAEAFPDDATVVTAEGVVLDQPPAGLASRVAALALDSLLVYSLLSALSAGIGAAAGAGASGTLVAMALAVVGAVALIGYPIAMETWWNGRTVGKAATGLRVVTVDGGPIGFRQAALRGALLLVDLAVVPLGFIGATGIVVSRRHQRLGDLAAGTLVVRERRPVLAPAVPYAFAPPYGWTGYAAALDVGRLDDGWYRTIRSFLLRAPQLTVAARTSLGVELAEAVVARLPARPPAGTPPEVFLTAVAAAYQQRYRRSPTGPPVR